MRRFLFALVLAGFALGCEASTPLSPDAPGGLQPAGECSEVGQSPC